MNTNRDGSHASEIQDLDKNAAACSGTLTQDSKESRLVGHSAYADEDGVLPFVVKRSDLAGINSVVVAGEEKNLGLLKDFRSHELLSKFIPADSRLSMSWVSLTSGEELETHKHPIRSMIVVTSGEVLLTGDTQQVLETGDIVCVPENAAHGFVGAGVDGFWGISTQFEKRGLYEIPNEPLVTFKDNVRTSEAEKYLDTLVHENQTWKTRIGQHKLFGMVEALSNPQMFLASFKSWSQCFQKLVLMRAALCSQDTFKSVTTEHLKDEFGHDEDFASISEIRLLPRLRAVLGWFTEQMIKLDDPARVVFMNLAIEGSATVFYQKLAPIFQESNYKNHVDIHNVMDHTHEGMGLENLDISSCAELQRLSSILTLTWEMIEELYTALATQMIPGVDAKPPG